MNRWLLSLGCVLTAALLAASDVEAKRVGGGRSVGMQRSAAETRPAAPPRQATAAPTAAASTPAASAGSRWLPLLGGLALGGLLGSFLGGSGFGATLLLVLLAVGTALALRAILRRRAEPQGAPMRYAAAGMPHGADGAIGSETVVAPPPSQAAGLESGAPRPSSASVPADFDVQGFLRAAKLNFIKLQIANDKGNLDEIREVTTREMFDELRGNIIERRGAGQQTDVVSLNADLLEVVTEGGRHCASVRFSGMVWETAGSAPVGFEEIWNLVKPLDGSSGWLLAGIQQAH